MPLAHQPFKVCPDVELISKKFLTFEDAADLLANGVGCRKIQSDSAEDLLRARESLEVPGASLISFQSIEKIVQSLQEEWTTWPKKLRLKRSPFLLVTGRLEINLHPVYLGDLGVGLRGQAGTLLHRWVEELQCIPLGFKEISPVGKHGAVVAASPFVHFYVHFKAVGFAPKKGDWLRGRVCEVQIEAGLNVTLVGLANCHIASKHLPRALRFCKKTKRWLGWQDEENGNSEDVSQPVVYVRVVDDMVVDKFTQSGKMFEINCRLGYPEKDMERVLREAQTAEKERLAKKLERKKAAQRPAQAAGTGDFTGSKEKADEQASSPKAKDLLNLAEETTASSSSKKEKREVAEEDTTSTPSKMKGGAAEDSTPPSRKKKKQDISDEADEQETTASSTSKNKRREVDDEVSSPRRRKKEDVMLNGDRKPRNKEVQVKKAKIKTEAAEETQEEPAPAKQKRGSTSEKASGAANRRTQKLAQKV